MKQKALIAVAIAAAVLLFLAANRGAYEGYFAADDMDTLSWAKYLSLRDVAKVLVAPWYDSSHFRPVGHFAYHVLANVAEFRFGRYVAFIHFLHLANTLLVLLLLRRLGLDRRASAFGAILFLFPVALADAFWKPMYLFDLLCAFHILCALLAYGSGRTVLAVVCFWLAVKSKEHAVMLPLILAGYEYTTGERRWRRLIPFFVISAIFSGSALLHRQPPDSSYAMRFSIPVVARTLSFYLSRVLLYPLLGVAVLALPRFVSDRRVWLGLGGFFALLAPLLVLPGRMLTAYLYVPMILLTVALAAASARLPAAAAALLLVVWLPLNYVHLRKYRRAELTHAAERRSYKAVVDQLPRDWPDTTRFVYERHPEEFPSWGVISSLRLAYQREVEVYSMDERERLPAGFWDASAVVLTWNPVLRKVTAYGRRADQPYESYVTVGDAMPVWQLGEGWHGVNGRYRWTKPEAEARVRRPEGAKEFEVRVLAGPDYINTVKRARIRVWLDGVEIGAGEHDSPGWHAHRFAAAGPPGTVKVKFVTEPKLQPNPWDAPLGSAVGGFGFR